MESFTDYAGALIAILLVVALAFLILIAAKAIWERPVLAGLLVTTTVANGGGVWLSLTAPPTPKPGTEFADPQAPSAHSNYWIACWPARKGGESCWV